MTGLIGHRCKYSNVLSQVVLISRVAWISFRLFSSSTKSEYLNTKQYQNPKFKCSKHGFDIRALNLFRI